MSLDSEVEDSVPVSEEKIGPLNFRKRAIFVSKLSKFLEYLRTEGKGNGDGYPENSVTERKSRILTAFSWLWENEDKSVELVPDQADDIVEALSNDDLRRSDGDTYSGDTKRKVCDALRNWLEWQGYDWEPDQSFRSSRTEQQADPFNRKQLRSIYQSSLEYKEVPSYNNLSPEERDRWKSHIAQELSKPKEDVSPDDWDRLNKNWKIPSLIRTTRSHGWRPKLVENMKVEWYIPKENRIHIPAGECPKNDEDWDAYLSDEGAIALENWLEQRENIANYDGRSELWLNREGNPYDSSSLNRLLTNLLNDANIDQKNNKYVWYSFRHSIGTYLFEEYKRLEPIAKQLRHVSTEVTSRYVHPTEDLQREASELM